MMDAQDLNQGNVIANDFIAENLVGGGGNGGGSVNSGNNGGGGGGGGGGGRKNFNNNRNNFGGGNNQVSDAFITSNTTRLKQISDLLQSNHTLFKISYSYEHLKTNRKSKICSTGFLINLELISLFTLIL